ncbi:MAG TPA: TonB-dependent receptor, partial [Myxococcaceae bacterium]|nr:TonB-dependent receptor [Myxococcaceae bacterium]
ESLDAESLLGAEAGAEVSASGLTLRATGFWNELEQPITNVTLATPLPDGARRQRQNLGRARVRGVELGVDWRFARRWTALVAYTLADSAVTEAPGNPDLLGKQLPQDPVHRATALLSFHDPTLFTATAQARWVGPQFEDDLNQLPLGGAVVVDVSASRRVLGNLELFAMIENLLGRRYLVGRAGIDTLGQPFTVLGGVRLREGP